MTKRFQDFGLRAELLQVLEEVGSSTPTPIQTKAIPVLLEGHDLIGVAETGTGKTLAFLLPMFHSFRSGEQDPQGLVICPTRELAIQVAGEAVRFGKPLGVRTVLAYGGTSSGDQKRGLAAGADLVVALRGDCWISSPRRGSPCAACAAWCSTKPIGCSTWGSSTTSTPSCAARR